MSSQSLARVWKLLGQIINFVELRLQKSVLLSASADFSLAQVYTRPTYN